MKGRDDNIVQSVDRAGDILETLAKNKNGCGVTEISNILGLHKSTVHRILATLLRKGYVEKDLESGNYKLGIKILLLGASILDRMDLRNIARPYIQDLSNKTKEIVHIAILDEGKAVYIDKVESPNRSIRMYSQVGKRAPLHCTAVGKVLLAGLRDEEVEKILNREGMPRFTSTTITDIQKMKNELSKIRKQGYGLDETEHEEEIRCVAAPIFDRNGKVVASISISVPIIYLTGDRMGELTAEILETAKEISYQLGYTDK